MSEATEGKPVSGELPAAPKMEPTPIRHRPSGVQELGTAALALLLYCLLLDAAVETLLSGAPVRWIVVGVVVGYIALSVFVWRRFSWGPKTAVTLLVLLGLLAATAWLPEGLSHGVSLLRQSTSTVLAALTGLAILLAGVILIRWRFVPLPGRVAASLAAAYGLAAVGLGIAQSVPYADLFHGRSLWDRLPFWLQGAFIGALVLMPIALLIHFLGGLWQVRGTPLRRWAVQGTALGLGLVTAVAALTAPTGTAQPPAPQVSAPQASVATALTPPVQAPQQSPPQPAVAPTPLAQAAAPSMLSVPQITVTPDEFVRMLKAYRKLPKIADRSSFDVKARAARVGGDLSAVFNFVRDQIANEIYPGVLRGPGGTLSAQAGNDVDKVLLLGALLAEQRRQVRYAQCTLTEELAQERIHAMFDRPPPPDSSDVGKFLKAALVEEGFPDRRSDDFVAARKASRDALTQAVVRNAQADVALVKDALSRAAIKTDLGAGPVDMLSEARNHYWIQAEAEGGWKDLDPAFPGAKPGQAFCTATQTYDEVPADAYQFVTLRIRNESAEEGKLTSGIVLEHRFATASLHGQPILFMNLPAASAGTLLGSGSGASSFAPVLLAGETPLVGEEFHISGGSAAGGGGGLFGQALGGSAEATLVGQWLEFELTAPGRRSIVSRAILDAVDSEERAKGTVSAQLDQVLATAILTQPYAIAISTGRLDTLQTIETTYPLLDLEAAGRVFAADVGGKGPQSLRQDLARILDGTLNMYAQQFASTADRMLGTAWKAAYPHTRIFRDQPLIVIANIGFRRSADGKRMIVGIALDVRTNVARVVSETPERTDEGFWLNAHHSLIDGALERYLLTFPPVRRTGTSPAGSSLETLSTSTLFDLATSQSISPRASVGDAAVSLLQQEFARTGGYRLAAEVREGVAAVVPARPVRWGQEERLGIWAVDLKSGHISALLDNGLRGDTTEYTKLTQTERMLADAALNCVRSWATPALAYVHCISVISKWREAANVLLEYIDALEGPLQTAITTMP